MQRVGGTLGDNWLPLVSAMLGDRPQTWTLELANYQQMNFLTPTWHISLYPGTDGTDQVPMEPNGNSTSLPSKTGQSTFISVSAPY